MVSMENSGRGGDAVLTEPIPFVIKVKDERFVFKPGRKLLSRLVIMEEIHSTFLSTERERETERKR